MNQCRVCLGPAGLLQPCEKCREAESGGRHFVCWRGQVYRFDADTQKEARAKAFRWMDARGCIGGALNAVRFGSNGPREAHRSVA